MNADQIRTRFETHILTELEVASATPTMEQWAQLDQTKAQFGWLPPVEYDGVMTVVYQPEILAALCGDLSDEHADMLLMAVEYMIDMHIFLADVPEEERTRLVESKMYDECGPDALALLSHQQFALIGAGG